MKMEIEFDETDPTQVANGLISMLTLALRTGVGVEANEDSYAVVTSPAKEECVKRWIGRDGEYRRDVMQRRWVVQESTDVSARKAPARAE